MDIMLAFLTNMNQNIRLLSYLGFKIELNLYFLILRNHVFSPCRNTDEVIISKIFSPSLQFLLLH